MSFVTRYVLTAAAAFLLVYTAAGQTTGTIVGSITDTSGAVVPNAAVTAINEQTGQTRETKTHSDGGYIFTLLQPGIYTVEAEAAGFRKSTTKGISVSVQENARVDVILTIGSVTEEVTVEAVAPLVDTRQASISALMETKRMVELPLSGRTPASLLVLIPTVSNVSPGDRPTSLTVNLHVAGGRRNANNFLLDNARYNSVQYGEGNPLPPPDFLSEFRVTMNQYDAEKGLGSASTVQVITRSGSNSLHGSLFEFHRDNALTARNFFAPTTPFLVQNQFGGAIGGPIRKNRTFFFGGYQATRIREAQFNNDAFPATEAEKNGDFSQSRGGPPLDPETGQPFPGGIIPRNRWDPAAVNLLSKLPAPNRPDGRFEHLRPRAEDGDQFVVKIDHNLFGSNQLSGRYWRSYGELNSPNGNLPYGNGLYSLHYQNLSISDTHSFSPSLINVFTFSWNRKFETSANANTPFQSPGDMGVNLPDPMTVPYPPTLTITGRFSVGPRIGGVPLRLDNTYDYGNTLTWIKGRSTWKLGGAWQPIRFGPGVAAFDNGRFTFNGQFTRNAIADLLIGRPSFLQMLVERENHRTYFLSFFAQNDFRLSTRITLNLGVRYHYEEPTYHADGYITNFLPGFRSQRFPTAPSGMAYFGDPGIPRGVFNADKNNFAPRVGIAWDLFGDGKTSLRAGYGIFTQPYSNGHSQFIALNQPFLPVFNLDVVPSFAEPFRGRPLGFGLVPGDPLAQFNPQTGQAVFLLPATGWSIDPNFPNPYVQQYSLSGQRQLPGDMSLEVSYIGNVGRKLSLFYQFNPAVPGSGATLANTESRRRYHPGEIGSMLRNTNGGSSSFNGLAFVLRKRFSRSYLLDMNYSWMRSLDHGSAISGQDSIQNPDNFKADWALSDHHRAHVFSASWVWELPQLRAMPAPARLIFGDWQLSGLVRLASGGPFNILSGRDNSLTAVGRDRPDVLGDPKLPTDRERGELIARYFDPTLFAANAAGRFGNLGRNALIGPGSATVDVGVFKNFRFFERHQLQFRTEFFNLLNRPNLGNPTSQLVSLAFGRILSAGPARQIQLALKYSF